MIKRRIFYNGKSKNNEYIFCFWLKNILYLRIYRNAIIFKTVLINKGGKVRAHRALEY